MVAIQRDQKQWWIQDFHEGAPNPEGHTLTYYWHNVYRKLHENERSWTDRRCATLASPLWMLCHRDEFHNVTRVTHVCVCVCGLNSSVRGQVSHLSLS